MHKQAVATFWTPEEINLEGDGRDWALLNNKKRHVVIHILAFFAASEGIVKEPSRKLHL
jgi:ribonucleoside-diphosphate reductase subunit M2